MTALLWAPSLNWMVEIALVFAVAVGLAWGWTRALNIMWALGFDRDKVGAFSNAPVRFALALWFWSVAVGVGPSPVGGFGDSQGGFHTTIFTARDVFLPSFFTLLATIWGFRSLRDMASGLVLSLTRPFLIGDEVATASAHGRVSNVGLTRVRMRTIQGELIDVPASELVSSTLRVAARGGGALPVVVEVELSAAGSPDVALERLRTHALLSAYADASVPVSVEMLSSRRARIVATPTHPDDADELRSDLASRATSMLTGQAESGRLAARSGQRVATGTLSRPLRDDVGSI